MKYGSFEQHTTNRDGEPKGDPLVEHFLGAPEELESLQELKRGSSEAWLRDGFAPSELFLNNEGDPVLVAHRDRVSAAIPEEEVYRFCYDGAVEDVAIPRGLQDSTVQPRGSGGYETVYDLSLADNEGSWIAEIDPSLVTPAEVPPALAGVVAKFGDKLVINVTDPEHDDERSLVGVVDGEESVIGRNIDSITRTVAEQRQQRDGSYGAATLNAEQLKQRKDSDHAEALELQTRAEQAAVGKKMGRFAARLVGKETEVAIAAYDKVIYGGESYEAHKKRYASRYGK